MARSRAGCSPTTLTPVHVGTFNAQGIHIGKDNPYPLPILSVDGESKEDIAMQTDMDFSMLAIVRGVDVTEIYKLVDVHMTDAKEHIKGFAKLLAEMYSLEKPAGQIFEEIKKNRFVTFFVNQNLSP